MLLLLPAPLFLLFELWQLVICERYAGIRQIERNGDPREIGPGEAVSFGWLSMLIVYWAWMALLLFQTLGRAHGIFLIAVTLLGYGLRRVSGLKWLLVILTFEGAVRIGLLFSLCFHVWRRL
ncbi:MAG: hypothetical protein IT582_10405 [Opitutaceae bacterium]|nr:hypothetical protein [Opitutaceae bacterium]